MNHLSFSSFNLAAISICRKDGGLDQFMMSATASTAVAGGASAGTQDLTLKSYLQLIGDPNAGKRMTV